MARVGPRALASLWLPTLLAASLALGESSLVPSERLSAGALSIADDGPLAFSRPAPGLDREGLETFAKGKEQFNERWVLAPEPDGVWGLGPTFNEDRCGRCHVGNGRAEPPDAGLEAELGLLVRLSVPGQGPYGGPRPHPVYGDQLQNRGIPGRVPPEGRAVVSYESLTLHYADGEAVELRRPRVSFQDLRFGELGPEVMTSARIAPAMVGLGLLEAVPEEQILALARRGEGTPTAGHPNYVWDLENDRRVLGRFGWKANQPDLRQQTAAAFHGDIGATSFYFPEKNCPPAQTACLELPSSSKCGGQGGCTGNSFRPEVLPSRLNNITTYLRTLAVPASRGGGDPIVRRGGELFAAAQCDACHVPELRTGAQVAVGLLRDQVIHPYTDLLLHDLGEGLADGRPDFLAGESQWRTAPLWGLGLVPAVNHHGYLLHDGRARGVAEAVLWHGGQAQGSREFFRSLPRNDREALVKFVESL